MPLAQDTSGADPGTPASRARQFAARLSRRRHQNRIAPREIVQIRRRDDRGRQNDARKPIAAPGLRNAAHTRSRRGPTGRRLDPQRRRRWRARCPRRPRRRRRSGLPRSCHVAPHSYASGTVVMSPTAPAGHALETPRVGPAPSQNACLRLGMWPARRRRDALPRAARSLTAMPEIDLPTVIFALVALFVAYKLRSVLGVRQDSERQPGGLLAPLRRIPAPSAPPVAQPDGAPSVLAQPPAADRWKGVADANPRGLERPRRDRRGGSQLLAAGLSVRRPHCLRHGRSCLRRRRYGDVAQPAGARSLRQFRQRDSQPRGRGTNDDDDRRVDRRRHHRRGAARRLARAAQSAFRRQARLRHSRCPRRGRRRLGQPLSPTISTCGLSPATFARATRTGC